MSLINESTRITDVLLFEEGEEINYVRDTITLLSGGAAVVIGQVLGSIKVAGATETHAGNTGNGVMTLDATTPVLLNAMAGVYTVKAITAAANGGTFRVTGPTGLVLGDVAVGATFSDRIKFVIADGATDFIVGDTFLVTVAAGSGKTGILTPAAIDGTAEAFAVAIEAGNPASADAQIVAVTRGPATFKLSGLVWPGGISAPQKAAAIVQLAALGMTVRSDF